MKVGFICPDGGKIKTEDCLKKCRMAGRCAPRQYLKYASNQKEKEKGTEGKPSVTELIRGTREAYLRRVEEYYESPEDSAFAVLGTTAHTSLEDGDSFEWAGITGVPDGYDEEERTLVEYKTFGSYKVAKVIGMEEVETGAINSKGKPVKEWRRTGVPDVEEIALQLGAYRMMLAEKNKPVESLNCHMIVRDGGTYIAKQRGITKNIYYVTIPELSGEEIESFFIYKRDELNKHLELRTLPVLCSPEECWEGNKCKGYCPVVEYCKLNPYI